MPDVKGRDCPPLDREKQATASTGDYSVPFPFDDLLLEIAERMEHMLAKALLFSEETEDLLLPRLLSRVIQDLAQRWRDDFESGSARTSMCEVSAVRIASAWRRTMVEAQGWAHQVSPSAGGEKGTAGSPTVQTAVEVSDLVLPEDLRQLLTSKVESGQYPSKNALIEEALRSFLVERPGQEDQEGIEATRSQSTREPSPFIEDEGVFGPGDIPRTGQKIGCRFLDHPTRWPDRFPGE